MGIYHETGVGTERNESAAVPLYRLAASLGHAPAKYRLALYNEKENIGLYRPLAMQGDANAAFRLGVYFKEGLGLGPPDLSEARKWFEKAVEFGHVNARSYLTAVESQIVKEEEARRDLCLSIRIEDGKFSPVFVQDNEKGREAATVTLEEKAKPEEVVTPPEDALSRGKDELDESKNIVTALQGDAEAQFNLGLDYELSDETGQNIMAISLYRLAAERGYPPAQNKLGVCYEEGCGVEKNVEEAVRLFREAASQGNLNAQYNLGVCYEEGIGVKKDAKEAARLFELAAAQDHAASLQKIESIQKVSFKDKKDPVSLRAKLGKKQETPAEDKTAAIPADPEDAVAQFNLAARYLEGISIRQDMAEAIRLFRLSAIAGGYTPAQYQLGICYRDGIGVNSNADAAFLWFKRAASAGNAAAQNEVGTYYRNGIGTTEKDVDEAAGWYEKSAAQGNVKALTNLALCYQDDWGGEINRRQAVELLKQAVAKEYRVAQYHLGVCYEFGRGVARDINEAIRLYGLASAQGYRKAGHRLNQCYQKLEAEKNSPTPMRSYKPPAKSTTSISKDLKTILAEKKLTGEEEKKSTGEVDKVKSTSESIVPPIEPAPFAVVVSKSEKEVVQLEDSKSEVK